MGKTNNKTTGKISCTREDMSSFIYTNLKGKTDNERAAFLADLIAEVSSPYETSDVPKIQFKVRQLLPLVGS